MSLANGLSILFIFSKNQLLVLLMFFSFIFFFYFYFENIPSHYPDTGESLTLGLY